MRGGGRGGGGDLAMCFGEEGVDARRAGGGGGGVV